MMLLILILSLFSSGIFVCGEIRLSLNSANSTNVWTVRNDSSSDQITANVPGGIYSDLNLVQDLLYRQNDLAYRWVAYENWTYETTFELSEEILNKTAINLVFHGIDTIGDIYLNGELLQSVDNMFVRYVIPIQDVAQETNKLEVRLKSPVLAAQELADEEGYEIIVECPENRVHGECHRNFLRKMQASFGWDIAPAFPSVGIWKPVEIEAFDRAIVRDSVGTVRLEDGYFIVDYFCHYESALEWDNMTNYILTAALGWRAPDATNVESILFKQTRTLQLNSNDSHKYVSSGTFDPLELTGPLTKPWWPHGYGEANLRYLRCDFETINNDSTLVLESSKEVRFGLKAVELVEEEITPGQEGLSYYFKVNGVPVFVKGTSWIPGHILPELGNDERTLRRMLQSVKDANMNMIRVWGGGKYESDLFYDICDELGIMVWQDLMFSDTLYPSNEKFLKSVATEVEQQIKRLSGHPSIAVWSGNDENELLISIIKYWGLTPENVTEQYVNDYLKLYVQTIKPIVEGIDYTRPYALASPSNGIESINEDYIAEDPMSPLYGTRVYTPIKDIRDPNLANSRFISEFGYLSMPSLKTISQVSLPEDWNLQSEFSVNREHFTRGYDRMTSIMEYFLPLPEDDGSEEFFKTYIYYSQILQAVGNRLASETYRVDRDRLKKGNEGMTGGFLLWHLNDVWQGPTMSSIEFGGRWKMAHYYAAKFFAPVTVVPQLEGDDELVIYAVSDLLEDTDATINLTLYSWDSFDFKLKISSNFVMEKSKSSRIKSHVLSALLSIANCSETTCFLHFTIETDNYANENIFYPASFKNVTNLKPANLAINVTKDENSADILINLTTDKIAPFVWLETDEEGIFSDNGFTLVTESKDITFNNRGEEIDIENFKNTLTVRSLLN